MPQRRARPKGIDIPVPPGLTLANTFRLVFNACFGTAYPYLEDRVTGEPGRRRGVRS